ncbi:MAG TPA: hypothetical protein EYH54_00540 [Nautiliaceae bacterium]|nr:hypothetical protein [Nautiliaceae bacterium]
MENKGKVSKFKILANYLKSEKKPIIILKHHFDGDGNTSVAIIERLLLDLGLRYRKISVVQNKYTIFDLVNDKVFFKNLSEKQDLKGTPVIIFLIDYGSYEETSINLISLKKYLEELGTIPFFVLIDHHPIENKKLLTRAFDLIYHHYEKNTSFLAREFYFKLIKALNYEPPKKSIYFVHEISYIGVLSDNFEELLPLFSFSDKKREELVKKYYVMEYLFNISKFTEKNLGVLEDIVFNFRGYSKLSSYLETKLADFINKAKSYIKEKEKIKDIVIKELEIDNINFRNLLFPNPKLFLRFLHEDNEILIAWKKGYIMLRAGKNVDIDFRGLLYIKEKYISNVGGHRRRFALNFPENLTDKIMEEVLNFIKKNAKILKKSK